MSEQYLPLGQNFTQSLPEIILNGSTSYLGSVANTAANTDNVIGNLDDAPGFYTPPSGTVPGESTTVYTDIRKLGQFMYQYIKIPGEYCIIDGTSTYLNPMSSPCTVTFTVPSGCVIHYTFGKSYPTPYNDNKTCFRYGILPQYTEGQLTGYIDNSSSGIPLVNNTAKDGTYIYAVAYAYDSITGVIEPNDQSPLLIAKFHINSL